MDKLIEYIGKKGIRKESSISLDMLSSMTLSVLADYIEGMEYDGEYDIDDYIVFDEWLSANPCVCFLNDKEGEAFSSIKDLAGVIINDMSYFSKSIILDGWENDKKFYSLKSLEEYNKEQISIDEAFDEEDWDKEDLDTLPMDYGS